MTTVGRFAPPQAALITPETHPDDPVVGRRFRSRLDGCIYFCHRYDARFGYWLERIATPPRGRRRRQIDFFDEPVRRVAEYAIGRTFERLKERGR